MAQRPRVPPQGTRCRAPRLEIVPVTFRQARAFITTHHRHHPPPPGIKFAVGVAADGHLVGVAIVGRPVARHLDDGRTAEVTRTCTDGTTNANSALYGAAWRAARALGYRRLVTYTQHLTCQVCSHADQAHVRPSPPSSPSPKGASERCARPGCSCTGYEPGETGASLRAAGLKPTAHLPAHRGWDRPSRRRRPQQAAVARTRWEISIAPGPQRCNPPTHGREQRLHRNHRARDEFHEDHER